RAAYPETVGETISREQYKANLDKLGKWVPVLTKYERGATPTNVDGTPVPHTEYVTLVLSDGKGKIAVPPTLLNNPYFAIANAEKGTMPQDPVMGIHQIVANQADVRWLQNTFSHMQEVASTLAGTKGVTLPKWMTDEDEYKEVLRKEPEIVSTIETYW